MFIILLLLQLPSLGSTILHDIPTPRAHNSAVRSVLEKLPKWMNDSISFSLGQNLGMNDDGARILPKINGGIHVEGGSGPTVLYAVNYYLRNYCQTQISWNGSTFGTKCELLKEELYFEAPKIRYFGNPCTFSYSFVWWTWEEWEVFIDWLAFNGFNMVLAPIGQEAIWRDLWIEMGLNRRDLDSYFTGPAYMAWHRMGNLKGYAGPVSDHFLDKQLELNKKIVKKLAKLGIIPILPTFSGFVPDALITLHPEKKAWEKQFVKNTCWDDFNSTYSCLTSVQPSEDLFIEIGARFLRKQTEIYGRQFHIYSADPMNEIPRQLQNYMYLRDLSWSVHAACTTGDSKCIWLLQSWTFSYDSWPKPAIKAFLSGVPHGRLLILDLYAEHYSLWNRLNSFYGHYFIWSMLHNFGGNTEIRGNLELLNLNYQIALTTRSSMVGAGLTMEGIHQNYLQYQFMIDRMWSTSKITINNWVENYVKSRYQTTNRTIIEAWQIIARTFYNETQPASAKNEKRFSLFIFERPQLKDIGIKYWFPMENLLNIMEKFEEIKELLWNNVLFKSDYNDFKKELLQFRLGNEYILRVAEAVGLGDQVMLRKACNLVYDSFDNMNNLTNYDYDAWEEASTRWAVDFYEEKIFARNARSLLSIWGPNGQNLDYAHRSWRGILTKYYAPRWKFLCTWLHSEFWNNQTAFNKEIFRHIETVFVARGRADIIHN